MESAIAANILGTTGAICWSVQLIPQIIVNYCRHHTTGLQPTMMLLWATAGIPLGVYNITQNFNVALQVQPQILTVLSLVTWAQCRYYSTGRVSDDDGGGNGNDDIIMTGSVVDDQQHQHHHQQQRWSLRKCIMIVSTLGIFMGGIEVALVFALHQATTGSKHLEWPGILMAVLAAVLLSLGVARHYLDIWKERTVRGISFLFVAIDALGDLTSLLSLFFQPELDALGIVIYGSELLLWLGVFACGGWYNFRPWLNDLRQRWSSGSSSSKALHQDQCADDANHATNTVGHTQDARVNIDARSTLSVASASPGSVFRTASGGRSEESQERSGMRLRTQTIQV